MRLVFVSGLYVPASGGAEISAHGLLLYLSSLGYRITVITGSRSDSATPDDDAETGGIEIVRTADASGVEGVLQATLERHRPAAVLTQASWSDVAITVARRHRLPIIFFLRGEFGELDISPGSPFEPDHIVANSSTVKRYIEDKWGRRDVLIVPPFIRAGEFTRQHGTRRYITMVNPVRHKGGFIVRDIASQAVDRLFLIVRAWGHLRQGRTWDRRKISELARANNVEPFVPEEADFDELPNVDVRDPTADMPSIYAVTRVLLVPSIVREGLPRVAVEAMMCGIPVLASGYGVRAEVIGAGGIMVEDYSNPSAWVDALSRLDDPSRYEALSEAALAHAAGYDSVAGAQPLTALLEQITACGSRC